MISGYKKDEIKYLQKQCNITFPEEMSLEEYIKIKRRGLLSLQENNKINITNRYIENNINLFKNPKLSFQYTYTRFDSYINYFDFLNDFYLVNNKKYKNKLFFTNSGMSAITSLLMSLKKICNSYSFVFPDSDIYFETYDFYNKYIKNNSVGEKEILYIDTISKYFETDKYLKILNTNSNIFAIILDTTCFSPNSLKRFISNILSSNIFCILIRSHTKLDMLGSELSSLGSLLYLIPNNISTDEFNKIKNVIAESYYILGKFGSLCLPENFPEIIFEQNFKKINEQRVKKIEKNNYCLFNYLQKNINRGRVILPVHQKFVLYIVENEVAFLKQNIMIEQKIKKMAKNDSQLYYACSFGFDFIALDSYYDINEQNYVIRISMNDAILDESILKRIKEFINDNF